MSQITAADGQNCIPKTSDNLPETNSILAPENDAWNTILSFWVA